MLVLDYCQLLVCLPGRIDRVFLLVRVEVVQVCWDSCAKAEKLLDFANWPLVAVVVEQPSLALIPVQLLGLGVALVVEISVLPPLVAVVVILAVVPVVLRSAWQ